MPNLNDEIAAWRKRMAAGGIKSPAVLDELESHLREEIRARLSAGTPEAMAFETAAAQIGSPDPLQAEFNKISGATCLPVIIGTCIWTAATILVVLLLSGRVLEGKLDLLLFVHIFTLVAGYFAAFSAGGFGIVTICWRWSGRLSSAREQSLSKASARFTYISGGLVIAGFLLGMLWSRQHLGAYWVGNPRGVGCLWACTWVVGLCLVQGFAKMNDHAITLLRILGNVIVGLGWFCAVSPQGAVNGIASYWPIQVFIGIHLLLVAIGFSRRFEMAQS